MIIFLFSLLLRVNFRRIRREFGQRVAAYKELYTAQGICLFPIGDTRQIPCDTFLDRAVHLQCETGITIFGHQRAIGADILRNCGKTLYLYLPVDAECAGNNTNANKFSGSTGAQRLLCLARGLLLLGSGGVRFISSLCFRLGRCRGRFRLCRRAFLGFCFRFCLLRIISLRRHGDNFGST